MYLLRRRSDGKYYRNPSYSAHWRHRNDLWIDDPNECHPFKTVRGIKLCRELYGKMPEHLYDYMNPEARAGRALWFSRANTKVRQKWTAEYFEKNYEAVEVKFNVKT